MFQTDSERNKIKRDLSVDGMGFSGQAWAGVKHHRWTLEQWKLWTDECHASLSGSLVFRKCQKNAVYHTNM